MTGSQQAARQYSQMMVGPTFGGSGARTSADWANNHDQLLRLYRGSVFIAAGAIAKKVASVGAKVYRIDLREKSGTVHKYPVSHEHPLAELLACPNENGCTAFDLHYLVTAWKLLCGNSYIWKWKNAFGIPTQIFPVSPQWVRVIPDSNNFIAGYRISARYWGSSQWDVRKAEMIHIKEENPDQFGVQRFYGFPTTVAVENTIELENEMFKRLRHTFNNYARPGLVFGTERRLQPHQLTQQVAEILSQHRVAEHTGKPMIVHDNMKLLAGMNDQQKELDYRGSLETTLKFTAAVFGVPLAVVGLMADQNRANAEAALYTFSHNTLNPFLEQYSQALTIGLAKDYGPDIRIQIGPFHVRDMQEVQKSMETAWRCGAVTPNEVRDRLLDLPPMTIGGDNPVVPAGSIMANWGNSEGTGLGVAVGNEIAAIDQDMVVANA